MKYTFKRTLAYLIDYALAFGLVMLLIQWAILTPLRPSLGITDTWFRNSWNMEFYVLLTISLPVWIYFTLQDASAKKGTVGKRIMKLAVVDAQTSERISYARAYFRTFLKLLPWEIAHAGVIFPEPSYYMDEPDVRILSIVGLVLFFVYFFSILLNKQHLSIYDKWVGVRVEEK